ncbi:hypothetical protein GWI33_019634 [Rhynchophorus ferrugineus]|uniref:Uncharacterized protein n=1 Tax=Rhynchophorus ferrugineus TaxID=354439 RepID=A0A834HTF6_RHYFE|nr:hypothetical protein GWI33_019634 [Rhynchophorus ferrugineus]
MRADALDKPDDRGLMLKMSTLLNAPERRAAASDKGGHRNLLLRREFVAVGNANALLTSFEFLSTKKLSGSMPPQ